MAAWPVDRAASSFERRRRLVFQSDLAGEISYEGTIEGITMQGTCIYGQLGEGTFEGSKSG